MPKYAVNPHNLTPEAQAKGRAAQAFTRKWYKETLLKIFKGEIKCTSTQLTALSKFADQRGWIPPNRPRSKPIADKRSRFNKPAASNDVLQRLVAFNVSALSPLPTNQTVANKPELTNDVRQLS